MAILSYISFVHIDFGRVRFFFYFFDSYKIMIKLLIIIVIEKQRTFSSLFLDDFMHFISFENKSYFICPFFF